MEKLLGGAALAAGFGGFAYAGLRNFGRLFTGKTTRAEKKTLVLLAVVETVVAIAFAAVLIALIEYSIPD